MFDTSIYQSETTQILIPRQASLVKLNQLKEKLLSALSICVFAIRPLNDNRKIDIPYGSAAPVNEVVENRKFTRT